MGHVRRLVAEAAAVEPIAISGAEAGGLSLGQALLELDLRPASHRPARRLRMATCVEVADREADSWLAMVGIGRGGAGDRERAGGDERHICGTAEKIGGAA